MLRTKTTHALVTVAAAALLLTGCQSAGAQNSNPVAKVPGSEESAARTDPAQANGSTCAVAGAAATAAINDSIGSSDVSGDHDDIDFADTNKTDGGWYIGASITPTQKDDTNDDEVAVWATTEDPTAEDFDAKIYAVNAAARDSSSAPSDLPSGFSATSSDAKKVISCTIEDVDH